MDFDKEQLTIEKQNGRDVTVEKSNFSLQDADGKVIATAIQFPVRLSYATTIHKSQGATYEQLWCDLSSLWEPGQAYVALSRLREESGLFLLRWGHSSIKVDRQVIDFDSHLQNESVLRI